MAYVSEPHPLVGNAPPPRRGPLNLRRMDASENALPTIAAAAYEQPITRQWTLFGPMYVVADPEGVKRVFLDNAANYPKTAMERRFFSTVFGDGLLSSEGETWRAHRRTMAPAFSPPSVASYAPGMAQDVVDFQPRWDQAPPDQPVDVAKDMTALTLQIISRAMFSADGSDLGEAMETALAEAMAATQAGLPDIIPVIDKIRQKAREQRIARVFARLDAAVARMTAEREAHPGASHDLLDRLIAARDAETGTGMTPREVRDQVVTIFVAGHETTAAAMTWIWYLLSQHPAEEARLHAELDAVLGGRAPTPDDLPNLPYARMVCEEAMRLYPPAPGTSTRQAQAADEICGMKIPKGANVVVAPWVTHRHKSLWERPDRFEPERFAKGAPPRHRFAYLPFGAGPRVCIGASLALTEMLIILAALAQRYRLTLAPGYRPAIQHQVTMRPKGGLPMIVHRR